MIKIICVGKIKEKFFRDAIEEYQKRLTKYTKINIIEVEDININNEELIKQKEKELILKHIEKKDYVITLEIEGKQLSSTELSKKIEELETFSSNITFIIGGSYGLDDEIKNLSNFKLSFSKLTFPHQLFRVILLEQIYRAYKIKNNESFVNSSNFLIKRVCVNKNSSSNVISYSIFESSLVIKIFPATSDDSYINCEILFILLKRE